MALIRKAALPDASRIAEILIFAKRSCYRNIFRNDQVSFGEMQVLSLAQEFLSGKRGMEHIWVYDDAFVKGMLHTADGEVLELYVDPFFQDAGIGSALLRFAVRERNANRLWVLEENRRAIRFYGDHGFIPTGERVLEPGTQAYLLRLALAAQDTGIHTTAKRGVLYGVGVGPGDPELLTLKARRILSQADVIAVPDKGAGEKTALHIIGPLAEGKPLLYCAAPMVRDQARLEAAYGENARKIAALLDEGKTVAFITLGDPSVYSTYLYTHRRILAMGYEAKIIPGVPSFCAVAAALGEGLCEGSQRMLVVPASHRDVGDCLEVDANYVFMKAGREMGRLRDTLAAHGLLDRAALVENCGMETERVYPRFADAPEDSGYFSVVVVKRDGR